MEKEKLKRMFEENEAELIRLDEIEEGYRQNPDIERDKRIQLLVSLEDTRQRRLRLREKLLKEMVDEVMS